MDPDAPRRDPDDVRDRLSRLKRAVIGSTSRPTAVQTRMLGEERSALMEAVGELNQAIAGMTELYRALAEQRLYPVVPAPIAGQR